MEKEKIKLTQKKAENSPAGGVVVGERDGQTMIYNDASVGGYFVGKTHSKGGIKMINKSNGQPLEVQGSEVIITAPAVADQTKREFEGKMMTNREILSAINEKGGGVAFAKGGDIPKDIKRTGASYKYGGKTMTDHEIYKYITGGHLAEGYSLREIASIHQVPLSTLKSQVRMGMKAESEHTSNKREQMLIVKDHLFENPEYYTLLKKAGLEDGGTFKDGGYVSYKDKYNKKYNYDKNTSHTLKEISKDTGVSMKGLQQIYNKGIGAYKTNPESVRPNVKSKEQWAMARVYSAVMGGKASKVDSNELKMNNGGGIFNTEPFLNYYFDEIAEFLKYQNDILLNKDFTFKYKGELFRIEPIILSENNIKEANFSIIDSEDEEVGEIKFNPDDKKQFFAYSHFFEWNNLKFDNGGELKTHHKEHESLVRDAKRGNNPARDLNNYNDVLDIDADGVYGAETGLYANGGLIAPNGNTSNLTPEQYKLVRTPEFKAWFGDWENDPENASKVVDENGEPMVVYHGTYVEKPFYSFDFEKADLGFHFGTYEQAKKRSETKLYNKDFKSIISSFFLNIRNLFEISDAGEFEYPQRYIDELVNDNIISEESAKKNRFYYAYQREDNKKIRDYLIKKYNNIGFVYENQHEGSGKSYIVLQPNQIKLADGTNTTFDNMNPNIRYADGGDVKPYKSIQVGDLFVMDLPNIYKNVDYGKKRQVGIVTETNDAEKIIIYNGRVYFHIKETSLLSNKKSTLSEVLKEFRKQSDMSVPQNLFAVVSELKNEVISDDVIELLEQRYPNRDITINNQYSFVEVKPKYLTDKTTYISKVKGYYLIQQYGFKEDEYYIFDSIEDAINLKYGQPIYAIGGYVKLYDANMEGDSAHLIKEKELSQEDINETIETLEILYDSAKRSEKREIKEAIEILKMI